MDARNTYDDDGNPERTIRGTRSVGRALVSAEVAPHPEIFFRHSSVQGQAFSYHAGRRGIEHTADEFTLFHNELALNLGETCFACTPSGDHATLDHRNALARPTTSCAVAVVQHAREIAAHLAIRPGEPYWVVSKRELEFDTFAAQYLARAVLLGVLPEPSRLARAAARVDWRGEHSIEAHADDRWALLLARYSARVSSGRRVHVARSRALHSVLYAAQRRGRDVYETRESVALFDEAREAILRGADPLFDTVLDPSGPFSFEFELLDRESAAYERDVQRGRKTLVSLPVAETNFPEWHAAVSAVPLLDDSGAFGASHETVMSPAQRLTMDGIYLRDPECLLFKEWARLDVENASLRRGFTFTFIGYSSERPNATNQTNYYVALDPENSGDAHLYGVWARLQAAERAGALAAGDEAQAPKHARDGYVGRAGADARSFDDPWYDGANARGTFVATPRSGTRLGPAGTRADCLDDAVAAIVRAAVEFVVFDGDLQYQDIDASRAGVHEPIIAIAPERAAAAAQPLASHHYRYAWARLHENLALDSGTLALQIARTLWSVLHPTDTPSDAELEEHAFRRDGLIGVWSRVGLAIAFVPSDTVSSRAETIERRLRFLIGCARDIDGLLTDLNDDLISKREAVAERANEGERILRSVARVQHDLGTGDGELLGAFMTATGIDKLAATLRDLSITKKLDEQNERTLSFTKATAETQDKLETIELLFTGIYATEVAAILADHALPDRFRLLSIMLVTSVISILAVRYLKPETLRLKAISGHWILGAFAALILVGLGYGILIAFRGHGL